MAKADEDTENESSTEILMIRAPGSIAIGAIHIQFTWTL
jgi:hypothetical protein